MRLSSKGIDYRLTSCFRRGAGPTWQVRKPSALQTDRQHGGDGRSNHLE